MRPSSFITRNAAKSCPEPWAHLSVCPGRSPEVGSIERSRTCGPKHAAARDGRSRLGRSVALPARTLARGQPFELGEIGSGAPRSASSTTSEREKRQRAPSDSPSLQRPSQDDGSEQPPLRTLRRLLHHTEPDPPRAQPEPALFIGMTGGGGALNRPSAAAIPGARARARAVGARRAPCSVRVLLSAQWQSGKRRLRHAHRRDREGIHTQSRRARKSTRMPRREAATLFDFTRRM